MPLHHTNAKINDSKRETLIKIRNSEDNKEHSNRGSNSSSPESRLSSKNSLILKAAQSAKKIVHKVDTFKNTG